MQDSELTAGLLLLVARLPDRPGRNSIGENESWSYAAGNSAWRVKRNSEPSSHIRCRMAASLRATAIAARFMPRFFASLRPQDFNAELSLERIIMDRAASNSRTRTSPSPRFEIDP